MAIGATRTASENSVGGFSPMVVNVDALALTAVDDDVVIAATLAVTADASVTAVDDDIAMAIIVDAVLLATVYTEANCMIILCTKLYLHEYWVLFGQSVIKITPVTSRIKCRVLTKSHL